jgi:hypothetical protein
MSTNNSSETIGNQTLVLSACSPVPQTTAPPRALREKCPLPKGIKPWFLGCPACSLVTMLTELPRSWRWSTNTAWRSIRWVSSLRNWRNFQPFVSKTYFDYLFNCWLSLVNELRGEITNGLNSDTSSRKRAGDMSRPNILQTIVPLFAGTCQSLGFNHATLRSDLTLGPIPVYPEVQPKFVFNEGMVGEVSFVLRLRQAIHRLTGYKGLYKMTNRTNGCLDWEKEVEINVSLIFSHRVFGWMPLCVSILPIQKSRSVTAKIVWNVGTAFQT